MYKDPSSQFLYEDLTSSIRIILLTSKITNKQTIIILGHSWRRSNISTYVLQAGSVGSICNAELKGQGSKRYCKDKIVSETMEKPTKYKILYDIDI